MARLLVCRTCQTMNRMQDYDGAVEFDMELAEVIRIHKERSPLPPESHMAQLFRVSDEEAAILDVESKLVETLSKEQLFIKETRDDLKVEALRCFDKHNRPGGDCPDWKDESKVIGFKKGIPPDKRRYLCEYCPVAARMKFREREKA